MPRFIRQVLGASFLLSVIFSAYWASHDMAAGMAFGIAAAWAMANIVVWSGLVLSFLRPEPRNGLIILGWVSAKFLLLGGGFVGLLVAAPLRRGTALGVTAGVSMVLLVIVLTALGAAISGVDLLKGGQPRNAAAVEDESQRIS